MSIAAEIEENAMSIAEEVGLFAGNPSLPSTVINPPEAAIVDAAAASTMHGYDIEGISDVEPHVMRHAVAFYGKLIPLFQEAPASFTVIEKSKYSTILTALTRVYQGETMSSLRSVYPNIHYWNKAYAVVDVGTPRNTLVVRPKHPTIEGMEHVELHELKRVTYIERVFADLLTAHGPDHTKGRTLYSRLVAIVHNVPRSICKLFTDLCPRCIERHQRNKPTAGLRPIVTDGFNVRGQVDLVDFQSMPDGEFRFLLNYIDHGIKFLFSIPITRKKGSCIAIALFQIFTIIGPPMILQSDNGSEFHGAALNARQVHLRHC